MLRIRKLGDRILRARTMPIAEITGQIERLAQNLVDTMHHAGGVGLAAPQVGIPLKIIAVDVGEGPLVLYNPRIVERKGEVVAPEGCLSIPGLQCEVARSEEVVVEFLSRDGLVQLSASGLLARVLQHEIDHINGILFVDRVVVNQGGTSRLSGA